MNRKLFAEIVGWYGAIALISAYALVSFRIIPADGAFFQLLNLTGAIGIIIISLYKGVGQSVVLNSFWAFIALLALLRLILIH